MKSSNRSIPPPGFLLIGEIAGVHGVRGNVKVVSYAETPDIFETDRPFLVLDARGETQTYTIDWVKLHKRGLLMAFQEVRDREGAEALMGASIFVDKADLPALESDTYYWFELIGVEVVDEAGACLGRISSIMPTGGNDVYVVTDKARGPGYEVLVPALGSVIKAVDLGKGVMTVALPEGL